VAIMEVQAGSNR